MKQELLQLSRQLTGELHTDEAVKIIYATDASAYREFPLAVAIPKTKDDIQHIITFANTHKIGVIPRAAGTSLAGQVVGNGIVVDISKYFTNIIEINTEEQYVVVEPGVIRDELNQFLKPLGFLFGPETSTANRAMIAGMVGNNSCGSNSVVFGSTREHLLEVTAFLSDGSEVVFNDVTAAQFESKKKSSNSLEASLYQHISQLLASPDKQAEIQERFPKPSIKRRNTGYALDMLLHNQVFTPTIDTPFNFCQLIAGSEGTLAFITQIKLRITPMPPKVSGVVVAHFNNLDESLRANLIALQHHPHAVELMDDKILDCTKGHPLYSKYRFFIDGAPKALLCIQLHAHSAEELQKRANQLTADIQQAGFGYAFPLVTGADVSKIWALRKAGLGLLANIPGDEKAVPVIEDTCVDVNDLPAYIEEFQLKLKQRNLSCVFYAHVGSGELHLRPMINLKSAEGANLFKAIAQDIADLVVKYNGSLSGEHGDGRLRGEFIAQMVGDELYNDFKVLKHTWDPNNIFNPQKIVDSPSMNTQLRYVPNAPEVKLDTAFNYSAFGGLLPSVEMCNGSADCRKTEVTGGIMCPSYMATRTEMHTTRARANMLRELITKRQEAAFESKELAESMELCLMCKGCKIECPSNVDMAMFKSEYLYQKQKTHPPSFAQKNMANFSKAMKQTQNLLPLAKLVMKSPLKKWVKKAAGVANERALPLPQKQSLWQWYQKEGRNEKTKTLSQVHEKVWFFCDEFTNYLDVEQGKTALKVLWKLGIDAQLLKESESGRTAISKGFLDLAKQLALQNVKDYKDLVSADSPLVGIEPSTLLSFRDEYKELLPKEWQQVVTKLSKNVLLFDEYLITLIERNLLTEKMCTPAHHEVLLHTHCHQKALGSQIDSKKILSLPKNYSVKIIPSGCCGMAGSFGYEHYNTSMKIGELVLFPSINNANKSVDICANGTSCRHQIADGTQKESKHIAQLVGEMLL